MGEFGFETLCVALNGYPEPWSSCPSDGRKNILMLLFLPLDRGVIPNFFFLDFNLKMLKVAEKLYQESQSGGVSYVFLQIQMWQGFHGS